MKKKHLFILLTFGILPLTPTLIAATQPRPTDPCFESDQATSYPFYGGYHIYVSTCTNPDPGGHNVEFDVLCKGTWSQILDDPPTWQASGGCIKDSYTTVPFTIQSSTAPYANGTYGSWWHAWPSGGGGG